MADEGNLGSTLIEEPPSVTSGEAAPASVPQVSDAPETVALPSLWRSGDFLRFWVAETLSLYGTQVTMLALPLTAVYLFHVGPAELGVLRFLQLFPYLAFSLLFGVWVDRSARRPVMLGANIARMLLVGSVPVLAALGILTPASLMAIAFCIGVASVLFDVSWMSYVPALVQDKRNLVEANTKLSISASSADVAGPGVAGFLVSALTAPVAMIADSFSYLVSVTLILFIRTPEPRPDSSPERRRLRRELVEGLRWVFDNQYLRWVALVGFGCNFILMFMSSLFVLYAVSDRALSPSTLGLVLSMGAVGGLLGSAIAGRVIRRCRLGRIYSVAMGAVFLGPALIPLASGSKATTSAMFIASFFICYAGLSVANVIIVSLRQTVTPPSLMGRMSAAMRMTLFGGGALGGLTSGLVGGTIGLRGALAVGAVASVAMVAPILGSPVARLTALPAPVDAARP